MLQYLALEVGTIRCRRSLHGPCHGQSGSGLSPGIMPASPTSAYAPISPGHLHPRVALETLSCALHFFAISSCSGHSHDKSHSLPHSWTCQECGKLLGSCMASPIQENTQKEVTASLTCSAEVTAVAMLVTAVGRTGGGHCCGRRSYDPWARDSAAGAAGGPSTGSQRRRSAFFSYRVRAPCGKMGRWSTACLPGQGAFLSHS